MKTFFLFLALLAAPLSARANCADNHDNLTGPKMNAAVQQGVLSIFKKRDIALDPAKVALTFTTTGFSTNFEDPQGRYVVFNGGGGIVSGSGTKFYLDLGGPSYDCGQGTNCNGFIIVYLAVLTSNGFDKEGNAINPHCTLQLAQPNISNYAASYSVKNSITDVVIGVLPLPSRVVLY
jgi:hypothetical protein